MNFYLEKYGYQPHSLQSDPHPELGLIVVIPAHNEPNIWPTLNSLIECDRPNCRVEVIVVVNASEEANQDILDQNAETVRQILSVESTDLNFHIIEENHLPKKQAGVGLARKIGMDEAVHRFDLLNRDGIIVCYDADSSCDSNYLRAIETHFLEHPKTPGCSIHYEHPTEGSEFDPIVYEGIIQYELHLRYYKLASACCELPYAFHTVGSSMAIRSSAYQKQGGMNKRKAGEDFYFLHKIIALGNFTELKNTKVIPSPRPSDRVPFGTGRAIEQWVDEAATSYLTYRFESFELIKTFVESIQSIYQSGKYQSSYSAFNSFLFENKFESAVAEIKSNTTDLSSFSKRFFVWFDAFRLLKLLHYLRDNGRPNASVQSQTEVLLKHLNHRNIPSNPLDSLDLLRKLECNS